MNHYDVVIVGGNFAGLSAAMQLVRARRNVALVDAGQPRNRFAPASHGFLGQDGATPAAIMQTGRAQLAAYPTFTFVEALARDAGLEDDRFTVTLDSDRDLSADRLILATGVRDELPAIPGLAERWGQTVVHCPSCHGFEFGQQPLGVLGIHSHSPMQAILVSDWGPTTYFTNGVIEPDEKTLANSTRRGITIERTPVSALVGKAPALDGVSLQDGRLIKVAGLFAASTVHMASPLAERLGCEFVEGPLGPHVQIDEHWRTSVPGVAAAGDAASAMHNATLASASGAIAGAKAHQAMLGLI